MTFKTVYIQPVKLEFVNPITRFIMHSSLNKTNMGMELFSRRRYDTVAALSHQTKSKVVFIEGMDFVQIKWT